MKRIALKVADRLAKFHQEEYRDFLSVMETAPLFELRKYQLERLKLLTWYWGKPIRTWDQFHDLPLSTKDDLDKHPPPEPGIPYRTQTTSGSTGQPRKIYLPVAGWHKKDVVFHRSWERIGRQRHHKVLRLIAGDPQYAWYDWLRNDKVMNRDNVEEAAAWIIDNQPFLIHGAGLPIREILERVIWLGFGDRLKGINVEWCSVSSEGHRQRLTPLLAGFYEQYGLAELATVASPCKEGNMHLVMEAGYTEIVNGEIVVTDFNNTLSPIIRYKTGDKGRLASGRFYSGKGCKCDLPYPILKDIKGRRCDYYNGPEVFRPIGWWVVSPLGHDYPGLERYHLEIWPKYGDATLYIKFKVGIPPGDGLALLEPYRQWFMNKTNLRLGFSTTSPYPSDDWKHHLVRINE